MTEPVVEVFVGLLATYTIVELFFGDCLERMGWKSVCVCGGGSYTGIYILQTLLSESLLPSLSHEARTTCPKLLCLHLNLVRIHMCHGEQLLTH